MIRNRYVRIIALLLVTALAGAVLGELVALFDLYAFEFRPLLQLGGYRGVFMTLALTAGLILLATRVTCAVRNRPQPFPRVSKFALLIAGLLWLWAIQWMYMATPLTSRAALLLKPKDLELVIKDRIAAQDFSDFSLTRKATEQSVPQLRTMYERVRLNNPDVYAVHPIGATIDKYARRYDIDPLLLFFRNYINSWYGEAPPGPVPFLYQMTPETVRDVVQIHLPAWFVESGLRRTLAASSFWTHSFGEAVGFKLRYAFHKATLDVSSQPYDVNIYSDIFLVLKEYPAEFPDVFQVRDPDPVRLAVRDSFLRLRDTALLPVYEQPYGHPEYDKVYYDAYRTDLKRFARAAYYLIALDFDFATRIQALLAKHDRDYYAEHLGQQRWEEIPSWQQLAMLAMVRDLYTPNVGHLAYNLYALPELNRTPVAFVASQAAADAEKLGPHQEKMWRPTHYELLWAGAAFQLRVLNEVWSLLNPRPIPGVGLEQTATDARNIVWLATGE